MKTFCCLQWHLVNRESARPSLGFIHRDLVPGDNLPTARDIHESGQLQ
jgi:hypothetical protein